MLDDGFQPIAKFENLRVTFQSKASEVVVLQDPPFQINGGVTVNLVRECGSGKLVSGLPMMRLIKFGAGARAGGQLWALPEKVVQLAMVKAQPTKMRKVCGNDIGMIFQELMTGFSPVFMNTGQLLEGLRLHLQSGQGVARERACDLMKQARIPEPERDLKQYLHELSEAIRQRVVIAMALA